MTDKVNALATAQPRNSRFATGKKTRVVEFEADLTNANSDDDDLLILASGLSFGDRISGIYPNAANVPALTTAADNDLGFYYKNEDGTFVELDKDILWDGVDLTSATAFGNILTGENAALDHSKNIGQHLSMGADQEPAGGVYLILTMNTGNTATATVSLRIEIDEATTE